MKVKGTFQTGNSELRGLDNIYVGERRPGSSIKVTFNTRDHRNYTVYLDQDAAVALGAALLKGVASPVEPGRPGF